MNDVAQRFEAGTRIRLAVSTSYWPLVWPAPEPAILQIDFGHSSLILPYRPPDPSDVALAQFESPEGAVPSPQTVLTPGKGQWRLEHDLGTDTHTVEVVDDSGTVRLDDIGLEVGTSAVERYSITGVDPTSARGEVRTIRTMRRDAWEVETTTSTVLSCTGGHFIIDAESVAFENRREVYRQSWHEEIPRRLV
jgi:hypothetical protein